MEGSRLRLLRRPWEAADDQGTKGCCAPGGQALAATTSRAATQSRKKPAARRAKTVAPSWQRLCAMAPPRVAAPLLALSVAAVTVVALLMLVTFVFTGRAVPAGGGAAAPATVARQQTRDDLVAARRAASCEVYLDLTAAQAQAIRLPPEEGIGALAALVVAVPAEQGSSLEPAFAHLRSALQLDVDAAAWTAVGEQQRALASYRLAEAEALQAEAYAAAVCGDE